MTEAKTLDLERSKVFFFEKTTSISKIRRLRRLILEIFGNFWKISRIRPSETAIGKAETTDGVVAPSLETGNWRTRERSSHFRERNEKKAEKIREKGFL